MCSAPLANSSVIIYSKPYRQDRTDRPVEKVVKKKRERETSLTMSALSLSERKEAAIALLSMRKGRFVYEDDQVDCE